MAAWRKTNLPGSVFALFRRAARVAFGCGAVVCDDAPLFKQGEHCQPIPIDLFQPDAPDHAACPRDEYFHWFEDLQGYTVVIEQGITFTPLWTPRIVVSDRISRRKNRSRHRGLYKRLLPSPETREQLRAQALPPPRNLRMTSESALPPGSVKKLVILCKFSDHVFGTHTRDRADYDVVCNAVVVTPHSRPQVA